MWAITSYYNPAGYRSRYANYQIFRKRLSVPLVTVEWSREGRFELQQGDADILIQISGGDVLWQKERLLNVALQAVPAACDKIAWLDCDIVFEDSNWPLVAARQLEDFSIVQLFERLVEIPEGVAPSGVTCQSHVDGFSATAALIKGVATARDLRPAANCQFRKFLTGLAWAARREVLERHGFYDVCIVGSGDRALFYTVFGSFEDTVQVMKLNDRRKAHYLRWAHAFHQEVCGRVGYLPGKLYHLWHGHLSDRRYGERHIEFNQFDFDPHVDIVIDDEGAWRWHSERPDMHEYVRTYFETRKEDGSPMEMVPGTT